MIPIITIDGPSGAGKGTISLALARSLGWRLLDSGAVYRALALVVAEDTTALSEEEVAKLALVLPLRCNFEEKPRFFLKQREVTQEIREEKVGVIASQIAQMGAVRKNLIDLQRSFWQAPGLVADGRDMGTVVFPEAPLKFFLEAQPRVRAQRRKIQLQAQGVNVSLAEVEAGLEARDERDRGRKVAPLRVDERAVIIDTTKLSVDEVLQLIRGYVEKTYEFNLPTLLGT